jgi:hypothetical protein
MPLSLLPGFGRGSGDSGIPDGYAPNSGPERW